MRAPPATQPWSCVRHQQPNHGHACATSNPALVMRAPPATQPWSCVRHQQPNHGHACLCASQPCTCVHIEKDATCAPRGDAACMASQRQQHRLTMSARESTCLRPSLGAFPSAPSPHAAPQ
eukprot:365675-Chlamydomonas_euryale.AAC.3